MMLPSRFIIELTPPLKLENLDKYYARISNLVRLTGQVSITSKYSSNSFHDNQSFALAKYLLEQQSTTDILFHLRAGDADKKSDMPFVSLRKAGITKLLLIEGDNHHESDEKDDVSLWKYMNSLDMLNHINRCYGESFQTLAVAGYPGGDGRRTYNNQMEFQRLSEKLNIRADAIYTQCVFDDKSFSDFKDKIRLKFTQVEIVPSVALFKNVKDLEKIANLTRVSDASIQHLKHKLQCIGVHNTYEYSITYLEELCRKLFESGAPKIDLCTFGNFNLAEDLILRLEKNVAGHSCAHH